MNLTFTQPTNFKNQLLRANIDFDAPNTFYAFLMRDGFTYSSSLHQYKKNFITNSGSKNYTIDAGTKTLTCGTGNFINNGFVVGNWVTTDHETTNQGPYQITALTATTMKLNPTSDQVTLVDQTATATTISTADEWSGVYNINGYDPGGFQVLFTLSNNTIILNELDFTLNGPFGESLETSPGFIVCKNAGDYPVVCYAKFSQWKISI